MSELRSFPVVLDNGDTGVMFATSRFFDNREDRLLRLSDGREFLVPRSALESRSDGTYHLRIPAAKLGEFEQFEQQRTESEHRMAEQPSSPARRGSGAEPGMNPDRVPNGETVIPVLQEALHVDKRVIETGRIRLQKSVETRNANLEETLLAREYDIERVPIDRVVDAPSDPRYEGDTLVLPVYEEVLVVEKRLVLREELRVTRRLRERRETQAIPVRREHIDVQRVR